MLIKYYIKLLILILIDWRKKIDGAQPRLECEILLNFSFYVLTTYYGICAVCSMQYSTHGKTHQKTPFFSDIKSQDSTVIDDLKFKCLTYEKSSVLRSTFLMAHYFCFHSHTLNVWKKHVRGQWLPPLNECQNGSKNHQFYHFGFCLF